MHSIEDQHTPRMFLQPLTITNDAEHAAVVAALARDADEAIRARAERDPEFRDAVNTAADEFDAVGNSETAHALRDYLRQSR